MTGKKGHFEVSGGMAYHGGSMQQNCSPQESEERAGLLQFHQNRAPSDLKYLVRLHLLKSKQLLYSVTLRFNTWAFGEHLRSCC